MKIWRPIWFGMRGAGHFRLYSARVKWQLLSAIFSQSLIRTSKKQSLLSLARWRVVQWKILAEFDAKEEGSAIINGHTPVKVKKESHRSKQTEKHLLLTEVYPKLIKKQPGLLATHYYAILTVSKSWHIIRSCLLNNNLQKSDQTNVKVIEQQLPRKLNRNTTKGMELQQQITQLQRLLDYRKDDWEKC